MKESYIIFESPGDLRKNIMATAVVSSIKKAYPEKKIVVVTTTPEVWLHNPNVYRFYAFGRLSYFYDDYINDKDTIIMRHDPYITEDFTYKRKHIIEIWCDLCGVPYDKSLPTLHFTWREKEAVGKLTNSDKPLFFIQTHAPAIIPQLPEFWATDIPIITAQKVVDMMNEKGYSTIHIRNENQPVLRNALTVNFDARLLLCAMERSDARLFNDSYAMHAATAFNLPSVIAWIAGDPNVSGYDIHKNIIAKMDTDMKEFADTYNESLIIGDVQLSCTLKRDSLFDPNILVEEILNLKNK